MRCIQSRPDVGILIALLVAYVSCVLAAPNSCRVYVVDNSQNPDRAWRTRSTIRVPHAYDVQEVGVTLDIKYNNISNLKITLSGGTNEAFQTVTLKESGQGRPDATTFTGTTFTDLAPESLPNDKSMRGNFKPVMPLATFSQGTEGAAGKGGSQGLWWLTVEDPTADDSAKAQLLRWELWLCGSKMSMEQKMDRVGEVQAMGAGQAEVETADGKMVVRVVSAEAPSVSSFSGFRSSSAGDIIRETKTSKTSSTHMGDAILDQLSSFHSGLPDGPLKKLMSGDLDRLHSQWGELSSMLEVFDGDNLMDLHKEVRERLMKCWGDLHGCFKEHKGFSRNHTLAGELAKRFQARTKPLVDRYTEHFQKLFDSLVKFQDANPHFAKFSDFLFNSAIRSLYRAAALEAVYSYYETYYDVVLGVALWANRFEVVLNPRVVATNLLTFALDGVKTGLRPLLFIPYGLTGNQGNNVNTAVTVAQNVVNGVSRLTQGTLGNVRLRSDSLLRQASGVADALAMTSDSVNQQILGALRSVSPDLANMLDPVISGVDSVTNSGLDMFRSGVDTLRTSAAQAEGLLAELQNTTALVGEVFVQFANTTAAAFDALGNAVDPYVPGLRLTEATTQFRQQTSEALTSAVENVAQLVPTAALEDARAILDDAVTQILDRVNAFADKAITPKEASGFRQLTSQVSANLRAAQETITNAGLSQALPGPLAATTLQIVRNQANRTVTDLTNVFTDLVQNFPAIDPQIFMNNLNGAIDDFLGRTAENVQTFQGLAPMREQAQLLNQVTETMNPVLDFLGQAAASFQAQLPASFSGDSAEGRKLLQSQAGGSWETNLLNQVVQGIGASTQRLQESMGSISTPEYQKSLTEAANRILANLQETSQSVDGAVASQDFSNAALKAINNQLAGVRDALANLPVRDIDLGEFIRSGPLGGALSALGLSVDRYRQQVEVVDNQLSQALSAITNNPVTQALGNIVEGARQVGVNLQNQLNNAGLGALRLAADGSVAAVDGLLGQVEFLTQAGDNLVRQLSEVNGFVAPQLLSVLRNTAAGAGQLYNGAVDPVVRVLVGIDGALDAVRNTAVGPLNQGVMQLANTVNDTAAGLGFIASQAGNAAQTVGSQLGAAGAAVQNLAAPVTGALAGAGNAVAETLAPLQQPTQELVGLLGQQLPEPVRGFVDSATSALSGAAQQLAAAAEQLGRGEEASPSLDVIRAQFRQSAPVDFNLVDIVANAGDTLNQGLATAVEELQKGVRQAFQLLPTRGAVLDSILAGGEGSPVMSTINSAIDSIGKAINNPQVGNGQVLKSLQEQLAGLIQPAPQPKVRLAQTPQVKASQGPDAGFVDLSTMGGDLLGQVVQDLQKLKTTNVVGATKEETKANADALLEKVTKTGP